MIWYFVFAIAVVTGQFWLLPAIVVFAMIHHFWKKEVKIPKRKPHRR